MPADSLPTAIMTLPLNLFRRPRWRTLVLLALLLASLLWPIEHLATRYYRERVAEQSAQTLELYVANLRGTLRRYEALPHIMGDLPALRGALRAAEDADSVNAANQLLDRVRRQSGADVIYLMNPAGLTLAASNWSEYDAFVGRNFAFRPYFREALAGRPAQFFGLGTTSGKRGYYFATAVRDGHEVLGVLVVKVDLDHTETLLGSTPEQLLVTDAQGVVILTSRPEWRFRATRELSAAERAEIAANLPYPTQQPQPLALGNQDWLRQSQLLAETGWTANILAPRSLVERPVQSVVAIAAATLLAILLLLAVWLQRRRHLLERLALDARARQELEQRVAERTEDLLALTERLKQEVLEREQAQQELVSAQDELVQAGKLSALGTMSASISHELNQPLAAIRSYADNAGVLLDHGRVDEARGNLKLISELTARMASIISHLKAFARRDRKAPESVALQPALDDALALLASQRRALQVELLRDLPDATLWVQAGETRLRQVLGNLLSNAFDALGDKAPPRRLWLSAQTLADGRVSLSLRDNGPGFTAEALARAREPFFTTKTTARGLGLGLAICDTLTRALGGELLLANHPAGGALVTLNLLPADTGIGTQSPEDCP
ncbi:two-component system, NtrC family, C4-dicarboxylate transport sensor histidine kinase DctB [Geopseudomonas sagittaria]|uniref:C4-dicarboxylate transport sensor protein DctB n=2 Tax=Geopseudomonas sagittaria TaxID=1135990 RepID=A0A1I5S539_9GAMM|nr:two-component system, NtrC family, C4-dicarboxylate transport sensor histidine kinase DctB [Pseudomonas sagittaria]